VTTYLAYIRSGMELTTAEEVRDRVDDIWIARQVILEKQPNRRRLVPVIRPLITGVAFLTATDAQWQDLRLKPVRHLRCTTQVLGRGDERQLAAFRAHHDGQFEADMRLVENASRTELMKFKKDQKLRVLEGPFADQVVRFQRLCESADGLHDEIEAWFNVAGGEVKLRVPAHSVKAAE
jgi:transcription antitermination factor NusG